ncbi:MAG: hypothetical protein L3V56_04850 [Candidatus Magnetoovum sp. WYHC-5]|nr:hypothetical protein [Candidatus Magnetoovum sp. WYHC-5]
MSNGEAHKEAVKYKRPFLTERFSIVAIGAIIAVLSISIVFAYILGASSGDEKATALAGNALDSKNASVTGISVVSFFIVFLCYGFVAVLLVAFLFYKAFSPFNRLIEDMGHILSGDYKRRLFLRQKDVFLLRDFVGNVNELVEKVEKMHIVNDELIRSIDNEATEVFALLESDGQVNEKTKEAVTSYHNKVKEMLEKHKTTQKEHDDE